MIKDKKEVHYSNDKSYHVVVKSELLPFAIGKKTFKSIEKSNKVLQKFINLVEKKFDSLWYIGTDFMGDDIFERFMFHHGGFMEVSLHGEIRCYFIEDKTKKMKNALIYAITKLSHKSSAMRIIKEAKVGQKLISLQDSVQ